MMNASMDIWNQVHYLACKAMEEEYEEMEAKRIAKLHAQGIFDDVIDEEEKVELEMEYKDLHPELIECGALNKKGYNPFAN